MVINLVLTTVIVLVFIAVIAYFFRGAPEAFEEVTPEDPYTYANVCRKIKKTFEFYEKQNLRELNLTKRETIKQQNLQNTIKYNLRRCPFGDPDSKRFVKDYIRQFLLKDVGITEENIELVMPFTSNLQKPSDKFFIMFYIYQRKYKNLAMKNFMLAHGLNLPKFDKSLNSRYYEVSDEDIEKVWVKMTEIIDKLTFHDKLGILCQRIYQDCFGNGPIDDLRDQEIDGVSAGVSGVPYSYRAYLRESHEFGIKADMPISSHESVWIMFKGNQTHLTFLSFGSQAELERVINNMYRYNSPGQLSSNRGFVTNSMEDGSRLVAMRPDFADGWCIFIRKLNAAAKMSLEELLIHDGKEKVIETTKWIIRGDNSTVVSGGQGSGKTTFLISIAQFLQLSYTIRTLQLTSELHLPIHYPSRNVKEVFETAYRTGQEALDVLKKTDANVTIVGETASFAVANHFIQTCEVGSDIGLTTHHGKTADDVISSFTSALLIAGGFTNESLAEYKVAKAINFNIHLIKNVLGDRYVERITEIIPDDTIKWPDEVENSDTLQDLYYKTVILFSKLYHHRRCYRAVNVIECIDGEYHYTNMLSDKTIDKIRSKIDPVDIPSFEEYLANMAKEVSEYVARTRSEVSAVG